MNNDVNFAWPVTTLCKYDYKALKQCIEENASLFHDKEIVIFGAGIRGTAFSIMLEKFGYTNIVFTDNNPEKVGGYINEFRIIDYKEVEKEKEKLIVLISVENGFALKKQLEKSGFVENVNYFYVENHLYDLYIEEFSRRGQIDNLIMGDCGITDISKADSDYTNLGELLKQKLGDNTTKVLAVHAMGMRAFYHILSVHIQYVSKIKNVVIMANFETFTGKQHLLPRSQHANLIQRISQSIENKDDELNEYVKITKERFDNFQMDYFASSKSIKKKMNRNINDKLVIGMNYMYELNEDNECIQYMKKIIALCKTNAINLLFFIPPANYMYAEELYGKVFAEKYNKNVSKLRDILQYENIELLDMSYMLESNQFAEIHTIDETANYEGRYIQANAIITKMKQIGMIK